MPLGCWSGGPDWSLHSFHGEVGLHLICSRLSLPTEKLLVQTASLALKMIDVPGIHHTGDELWSWRMGCNGTGSGHRLSTLLHMTYMPPIAYMNSGLVTILRFSGEGTKNSHMVCSRAPNNEMLALGCASGIIKHHHMAYDNLFR